MTVEVTQEELTQSVATRLLNRMKCVERQVIQGASDGSLQYMAEATYFAELRFLGLDREHHRAAMDLVQGEIKKQFQAVKDVPGFPASIWAQ